jgi:hypothetical protein
MEKVNTKSFHVPNHHTNVKRLNAPNQFILRTNKINGAKPEKLNE